MLFAVCPRLKPRLFSIASFESQEVDSHIDLHIVASIVTWVTPMKRKRVGLCSKYLQGLGIGDLVPVWIQSGSLYFPLKQLQVKETCPMILVATGTGCAPFRSLMQVTSTLHCYLKNAVFDWWINLQLHFFRWFVESIFRGRMKFSSSLGVERNLKTAFSMKNGSI